MLSSCRPCLATCRKALLGGSALVGAAFTAAMLAPNAALAACAVTAGGSVTCATTTTTDTTNTNAATAASADREQLFNNGANITAGINGGATVDGLGLALTNTSAGKTIDITNSGFVTLGILPGGAHGGAAALNLSTSNGNITYSGAGNVSVGVAVTAIQSSSGTGTTLITTSGFISGGNGIVANSTTGAITVSVTAGEVAGLGSSVFATASGAGDVTINTATGTAVLTQAGNQNITAVSNGGVVSVVTAGIVGSSFSGVNGDGIIASNTGAGNVTVAVSNFVFSDLNAAIRALTTGSGTITVTQSAGTIAQGSGVIDGIRAGNSGGTGAQVVVNQTGGSIGTALAKVGGNGVVVLAGASNINITQSAGASVFAAGNGIQIGTPTGPANVVVGGTVLGATGLALSGGTTTLDLRGTLTGIGGTAINLAAGTLVVGGSSPFGTLTGGIVDGGTVQFNRADTITLSNVISGGGIVQQNGGGTTILTGTNTYTGATAVNAGTLLVNGSIISSSLTTVNSGGKLAGTGTVGATTIASGGTFAPGLTAAPGLMTVNGPLTFISGSTYLVQVTPATASEAVVGGTATLAGTVSAQFQPGSYVTKTYTILHSSGLGGTQFSGLTTNLPGFTTSLSYVGNDVDLNLTAALAALGSNLTVNQQNVANGINSAFNGGAPLPAAFFNIFGLSGVGLGNALSQLSGEVATGAQRAGFQLSSGFLGLLADPGADSGGPNGGQMMAYAGEDDLRSDVAQAYAAALKAPAVKPTAFEQRWNVWGSAYGGQYRTDGDPTGLGSRDLSANAGGFASGADYRVSPFTTLGFALAGAGTNWSLAQGLGNGRSNAFQAGLYGKTTVGPVYLSAAVAFAQHWMSTNRTSFAGDQLTAKFSAQSYGGRVEAGYRIHSPMAVVTPYAAIQGQAYVTPTYSETDVSAGGFGLSFAGATATDTRGEVGARFDRAVAIEPTKLLVLRAKVGYAHDWLSNPSLGAVFLALPAAGFVVNGAIPAHNLAIASAGAELRFVNGVVWSGRFDGEVAAHSQTYAGTGTVRYSW